MLSDTVDTYAVLIFTFFIASILFIAFLENKLQRQSKRNMKRTGIKKQLFETWVKPKRAHPKLQSHIKANHCFTLLPWLCGAPV